MIEDAATRMAEAKLAMGELDRKSHAGVEGMARYFRAKEKLQQRYDSAHRDLQQAVLNEIIAEDRRGKGVADSLSQRERGF